MQTARSTPSGNYHPSSPGVFSISPFILLPSTETRFAIYLKQQDRLVLYASRGERFTVGHRERLISLGIDKIYISTDDKGLYDEYMRGNLGAVLVDESLTVEKRATAWHDCTISMIKDLFEEDASRGAITSYRRISNLVKSCMKFISDPMTLQEMSRFLNKGFDIYTHGLSTMILANALLRTYENLDDTLPVACAMGAMLHDMGKSRFPEELLSKDPYDYTDEERTILRSHPTVGVSLCSRLPLLQETLQCILFHHEREDGNGYPSAAPGSDIPFYPKVLGICDVYDNYVRPQGYRGAFTPFEALKMIKDDDGAFPPELLKRLIMVLSKAEIT